MKIEHKSFGFEVKEVDLEHGTFDGYASTFGVVDDGMDVVEPGAFAKTIQERFKRIRVGYNHNLDDPIGRPLTLAEHTREQLPESLRARFPQATGGLYTKSQISLTSRGRDVLTLLRDGVLNEMSFAYDPIKFDFDENPATKAQVRHLREVRLWEYGPVTWGMNEAAAILGAKSVVPFQDLPLADEGAGWDGAAARKRVQEWAGGDTWSPEKYRRAFLWYDESAQDKLGSYKLGIADIVDGRLTAVMRGIFAAAAVLQGGRGGVDIPEADIARCKAHLDKYYAKLDRDAPWKRALPDALAVDLEMLVSQRAGLERLAAALSALRAASAEPSSDVATLTARARVLSARFKIAGGLP
jgi:HK97 family phage prohead protease